MPRRKKKRAVVPKRKVTFDGEVYVIPKISKGRNLTKPQKIAIAKVVTLIYSTDRHTILQSLEMVGIFSESTWYKWCTEIEEIDILYKTAQENKDKIYRRGITERARTTLEKYLTGYTETITERRGELTDELDKETGQPTGRQVIRTETLIEREIYIRPSMDAVKFVLTNIDGRNFTKNPEPYKSGNKELPTDLKIEIIGDTPPVTNEEDIKDV